MWEYDVTFCEELDLKEECGIVAGDTIPDAIANLIERFGEGNINGLQISFLRSEQVVPYKESSGKSLKHLFEEE